MFKENKDTLIYHLTDFHQQYEMEKYGNPELNVHQYAKSYVKNQIDMENGMDEYLAALADVAKYNNRVLRAIKSVKGKTYFKHLCEYIKDAGMNQWCQFKIVRQPVGKMQEVSEYGRGITKEYVDQRSVGTEGDSFEGTICLEIKPGKYLKFSYSC